MRTSLLSLRPWGLFRFLGSCALGVQLLVGCSDPDPLVALEANRAIGNPAASPASPTEPAPCEATEGAFAAGCSSSSPTGGGIGLPFSWGGSSIVSAPDVSGQQPSEAPLMAAGSGLAVSEESIPPEPGSGVGGSVSRPEGVDSDGFFVVDGRLFDALGNDFIPRGVNNPLVWFQDRNTGALRWLDDIAEAGANSVRLVWEAGRGADVQLLRDAVERTVELKMIPIVELHDETGGTDVGGPSRMADYCIRELFEVVEEFEEYLVLNLANEWSGSDEIYVEAYSLAIDRLRGAGMHLTLMIDANGRGQRGETLLREGERLLELDPQHNLLFSVHVYEAFRTERDIAQLFEQAVAASVPLVVGEFGFERQTPSGERATIPYQALLTHAERWGIGYWAWSWTGNDDDGLNLTAASGSLEDLTVWGDDVVNGPYGLKQTSVPATVFAER